MLCTSYLVVLIIGSLRPAYCNPNAWWNQLMTKVEARQNNQWTTLGSHSDQSTAQTTNRPLKRNNWININNNLNNEGQPESQARQSVKSWDKSYTKRRSYKSSWSDSQPFRERYVETEWDDDMPTHHVVRDNWHNKESNRNSNSDTDKQYIANDNTNRQWFDDHGNSEEVARQVVGPEKQAYNGKDETLNYWHTRLQQQKPERLISNRADIIEDSIEDNYEKASKLRDDDWSTIAVEPIKNNNKDQKWERLTTPQFSYADSEDDLVTPAKPKMRVIFETTSAKPNKISAKFNDSKKKNVTNNSDRTLNSGLQFGWRSSINHGNGNSNSQTTSTQTTKPKSASLNSYLGVQTTVRPKQPITTTTTRTTLKPTKSPVNVVTESVANNKKQQRIGSWVDRESFDEPEDNNWERTPIISQPLVEEEYNGEQLPERVEEITASPRNSNQREMINEENANHDDPTNWKLEDSIPGTPVTDYPTYASVPRTSFNCKDHEWPGYYADVEAQCQVFHICQTGGRKDSFLCPNGTIFNQQLFVCDWWHNVQCDDNPSHFGLNQNIYDYNWESKRSTTTPSPARGSIRRTATIQEIDDLSTPARNTGVTTEAIESDTVLNEPEDVSTDAIETDEKPILVSKSSRLTSPVRYRSTRYSAHSSRRKRDD